MFCLKQKELKKIRRILKNDLEAIIQNSQLINDFIKSKENWLKSDDALLLDFTKIVTGEYFRERQEQLYAGLLVEAMATIEAGLKLFYKQLSQSNDEISFVNPSQIIAKIKYKTGVKMNNTDFHKLNYFIELRNKLVHDSFKIGILEADQSKQFDFLYNCLNDSISIINNYLKKVYKKTVK